ncbi:unnamed protein product [Ectocarpus sp. 6 AP-2014]
MEAELEGMLVGAWIHGDRTKLILRVEALQRELSLIKSGRLAQREAFEAQQKKEFVRRLVDIKAEHERIVREVTSRATREERRRTICEKRVQDLEDEVLLLKEQLQVAAMKNREMERTYKRERASNSRLRHRELKRSTGCSDDGESVPAPAASQDRCVAVDGILSQPSFGPNLRADCGSGNVSGVREENAEGAEELRVEERLVTGLLEQSLRPGFAVRHSKAAGSHSPTRFCEGESNERAISTSALSDAGCSRKEEEQEQQRNVASAARATKADSAQTPDAELRSESLTRGGHPQEEGSNEKKTVNVDLALSRIHALTGMMRAQEEIETLLGQQLGELKLKQADESKRMWQLVARWNRVLENKGYAAEEDIRSAGLLEELQQRLSAEGLQPQGSLDREKRVPSLP